MREINAQLITDKVAELCIDANCSLPCDIRKRIEDARANEPWATAQGILDKIIENYNIADENRAPICQDTGVACVFLKIGQDVHINGDLTEAVNEGVRRGYRDGYLRKSVVKDPLRRVNTGDNTPAMLYIELVPGDKIELTVAPKGFGSENMSRIQMLKPADGEKGVREFILSAVEKAGPNPCPPIIVGVGIGGTFDKCAQLSKFALMRPVGSQHPDPAYAAMERELLDEINRMDIGPAGLGGRTTALAVHIETYPTHIAGLPVAVNLCCHAYRHAHAVL